MGESTRSRQFHPATSSDFDETFRLCRASFADHFGKQVFELAFVFIKIQVKYY